MDKYLLSLIIFLPLIGGFILMGLPKKNHKFIKLLALSISTIVFVFAIYATYKFDLKNLKYGEYQLVEKYIWFDNLNIYYYVGIDAISLPFILLTTLLIPLCVIASWETVKQNLKTYYALFLILESCILGVFLALDAVLFYIFFEAVLIPMFIIIGVWGSENRIYAAFKFFLYTLLGSVLFLFTLIFIYVKTGATDMTVLTSILPTMPVELQKILWIGLFLGFAIKIPMWPFHTWLPDAHVQAPTAGSMILAGVLLKLGAYGFIRFSLTMLPEASYYFKDYIFILGDVAIIYASLVAFAQDNMKKLIAYSSIAHMGYVTNGIFAMNIEGMQGAIMQMVSHGLISAALFMVVGSLYERVHSKDISDFGGVATKMPFFATLFMVFTLASVALPGTSGFIGELLSLVGLYKTNAYYAMAATIGMVLGAMYMLVLYKRVMFGGLNNKLLNLLKPLNSFEMVIYVPLLILVIILGIYPALLLDLTESTVVSLVKHLAFYT